MPIKCPNCEQEIADDSPFTPAEVSNAIEGESSWETLDYRFSHHNPTKHLVVPIRGKNVTINVLEKIEPQNMPPNEYDRQGETYLAYLIVEAGGAFFRKQAHVDSYGEETWSGPLTRVNRVEKTVQVWE